MLLRANTHAQLIAACRRAEKEREQVRQVLKAIGAVRVLLAKLASMNSVRGRAQGRLQKLTSMSSAQILQLLKHPGLIERLLAEIEEEIVAELRHLQLERLDEELKHLAEALLELQRWARCGNSAAAISLFQELLDERRSIQSCRFESMASTASITFS